MATSAASPVALLNAAYRELDLASGALVDAAERPSGDLREDWVNRGEWLALAKRVGAEKVFFVENNPVLVFAQIPDTQAEGSRELFNRAWCMGRPQCLFLATPGELAVYDLTRSPARPGEQLDSMGRLLARARSVVEVQSKLCEFARGQVESGRLFAERRFGDAGERADQALVRDLVTVRDLLIDAGLEAPYAHALIGRSIFVRYLEDRGILVEEDFRRVARRTSGWIKLLNESPAIPDIDSEMSGRLYTRVLSDKDFTYALFQQLAADFNGDMFPADAGEENAVRAKHLKLLQRFLRGDPDPNRPRLFFFAYRFDVIPIELISSIYEAFYNADRKSQGNHGSHYTPSALVEFVLSSVLTPGRLAENPCIADISCGSGIFLVEAFRRIVRYRVQQKHARLGLPELRKILRDQIRGIEINGEAVRVAAFSLYLALLHYLGPPDIWRDKRLPCLKYDPGAGSEDENSFNILLEANAFAVDSLPAPSAVRLRFGTVAADIVVGNPPWGYPPPKDRVGRDATDIALRWCKDRGKPVGDKEPSQAFVHRSIDMLREGGRAALLVSAGVLHKQGGESEHFRDSWLRSAELVKVVNFTHVRHLFFGGAQPKGMRRGTRRKTSIAPFAAVVFKKTDTPDRARRFEYWSAKRTAMLSRLRAVVLSRSDLHMLAQDDRARRDAFWKTYWWGNHRDDALVAALKLHPSLSCFSDKGGRLVEYSSEGFKEHDGRSKLQAPEWFPKLSELPVSRFHRYLPVRTRDLEVPPPAAARPRVEKLYRGCRLLVKQTPVSRANRQGEIVARLETRPFSFRHSIYGFRFRSSACWEPKVILAVFWSSLARYYLFLESGSWGTWYDKVSIDDVRSMPIRLPEDRGLRERILRIVDQFRSPELANAPPDAPLLNSRLAELEHKLDDAVFDLYELTEAERDLVRDMCVTGLDLFYNHVKSDAVKHVAQDRPKKRAGTVADLPHNEAGLEAYLRAFLEIWNRELEPTGEFRWQVIRPGADAPLVGAVFSTQFKDTPLPAVSYSEQAEWERVLTHLNTGMLKEWQQGRLYIDGLVRVVTDTDCIIIKRNERRFWTRSAAREDAEAALLQALQLQQAKRGRRK
jgi:hypothetical protein